MPWLVDVALAVVRLRLSSTSEKPLSTSLETLSASMAISTRYMRLIIFWRGETRFFLIGIGGEVYDCWFCAGRTFMFTVSACIIRAYTLLSSSICWAMRRVCSSICSMVLTCLLMLRNCNS